MLRRLFRFEVIDVVIAMGVASLINGAMLIMAASTFYYQGLTTSAPSRKPTSPCNRCWARPPATVFAISLLASGLCLRPRWARWPAR